MKEQEQISLLLAKWDELRTNGEEITPEELCRDYPELLPALKERIQAIRDMEEKFPEDLPSTDPQTVDFDATQSSTPATVEQLGRHRIVRELGRGGMGMVYLAHDPELKRHVAIKVVKAGIQDDPDYAKQFLREAEAVAKFQHPNIVQIYEISEHNGQPFFVMEYVEGGTLSERLRESPLTAKEAAKLVETLALAMEVAHEKGIVHRDLKPGNVLLANDGTPKITDFGLAKRLGDDEHSQPGIKGTVSYMAPEQTQEDSSQITAKTDVYALGTILYQCLVGRPPFQGATMVDTLAAIRSQEPIRPRVLNPSLPRDLETICLRCLEKDPGKRYSRTANLADDLRRWQASEPIKARPIGKVERLAKWVRRHPTQAALVMVCVLAVIVFLGSRVWFNERLQEQMQETSKNAQDARRQKFIAAKEKDRADKEGAAALTAKNKLLTSKARSLCLAIVEEIDLGKPIPPLTANEKKSLEELAGTDQEGLRLKFVELALRTQVTTRQLLNRGEHFLHAAAGLSLSRRKAVEALCVDHLHNSTLTFEHRTDVALLAAKLGGLHPNTIKVVAIVLTDAMIKNDDGDFLKVLARALGSLAKHMDQDDAAKAAHRLATAMADSKDSRVLEPLSWGLVAMAGQLDPQAADVVCSQVADTLTTTMANSFDRSDLYRLELALTTVAKHMNTQEAAKLISKLMLETNRDCEGLAVGFSYITKRAKSKDAADVLITLTTKLVAREKAPPISLYYLSACLEVVAGELDSEQVGRASRILANGVVRIIESNVVQKGRVLESFKYALAAMAKHIRPKDAAVAADTLASAMAAAKTNRNFDLNFLYSGLKAVSGGQEPGDAAKTAKTLLAALNKSKDYKVKRVLAAGLEAGVQLVLGWEIRRS